MTVHRTRIIRSMGASELDAYFRTLRATALPVGTFKGVAWSHDLPWLSKMTKAWRGKVFEGATVRNNIGGQLVVPGHVALLYGTVNIEYLALGLSDVLRPINDRSWLGRMALGTSVVWFTLEAAR